MLAIYLLAVYGAIELESTCGLYRGTVTVAGKNIPLTFDTGSSSLWIKNTRNVCSPTKGSWEIDYNRGKVQGKYCASTQKVTAGSCEVSVKELAIGTDVGTAITSCTDGTLGLGMPSANAEAGQPFLKSMNLHTQCDNKAIMSWAFEGDTSTALLEFGKGQPNKYDGVLLTENLHSFEKCKLDIWTVAVSAVRVNDKQLQLSSSHAAIFDTGSTVTLLPESYKAELNAGSSLTGKLKIEFADIFIELDNVQIAFSDDPRVVIGKNALKYAYMELDAHDDCVRLARLKGHTQFTVGTLETTHEYGPKEGCKVSKALQWVVLGIVGVLVAGACFVLIKPFFNKQH